MFLNPDGAFAPLIVGCRDDSQMTADAVNAERELSRRGAMLVLSRKRDESIVIDGDIQVTVLAIHGRRVKLGISCPAEVPIHRGEIWAAFERKKSTENGFSRSAVELTPVA